MKYKEKVYSIALASTVMIIFLILVSSMASAAPGQEGTGTTTKSIQSAAPKITETRITTTGSASDPHIYGDRVVYEDNRNGISDIYMYDLSTKREAQISTSGTAYYPAIYGDRIVWKDDRNGKSDIYMYDILNSKEIQISTTGIACSGDTFSGPDIYNDKIVWQENIEDETYGIFMYNLSTQQETMIVEESTIDFYPGLGSFAIHGDKIVYNYFPGDFSLIAMYDLSTQQETGIAGSRIRSPDIYGDRIVWVETSVDDEENPSYYDHNIYMYDLSTQQETQITTHGSADYPAIYENRIAWQDQRNGNWDIYVYDLSTRQESNTTDKSDQSYPDMYGNKIVWTDMRNGNPDIYMGTLSTPPIAAFSASPTSGKAPLKVQFTDKSTGTPTSWKWNFGDKTSYSTAKNPSHKYSKAGKYTVKLTVKNAAGSNTKTMSEYIKVSKK